MRETNKTIEILAPGGSDASLRAAVRAGCDAVYAGGELFGARAYAGNFKKDELFDAIDYVHLHGKKIYLTVNTLLKEQEMKGLYDYLLAYYEYGIDAAIVQDLGVLSFIHREFPDLPIHGSTQMTTTMSGGIRTLKDMGLTRIVLSRELNLDEIREIREQTDVEIEAFVHGALCYCYSGQCLMSSLIGGRSGNRGRCAQPCRMPYEVSNRDFGIHEDKLHILSPKDVCTLPLIPKLIEAGIDSFKIEGRMKGPEYTALTVSKYKKYLDLYRTLGSSGYEEYIIKNKSELDADILELSDIYNRGSFTKGYYVQQNGPKMMSMDRPNHNGVKVGKVIKVRDNRASIRLEQKVNAQDVLEIRGDSESTYEFTVKDNTENGTVLETNLYRGNKIKQNQEVYRLRNQSLLKRAASEYIDKEKRIGIRGIFTAQAREEMKLTLFYLDELNVTVCGDITEEAKNQPTVAEKVKAQLSKTGDTAFVFDSLELNMDEHVFIPVSKLNELRREGISSLEEAVTSCYRRNVTEREIADHNNTDLNFAAPIAKNKANLNNMESECNNDSKRFKHTENNTGIAVQMMNQSILKRVLLRPEVDAVYYDLSDTPFEEIPSIIDEVKKSGKKLYFAMPYIFRSSTSRLFQQNLALFQNKGIHGFLIRNLETYDFLIHTLKSEEFAHDIILDYNMYTMNREAEFFFRNKKVSHMTAPLELNRRELKEKGLMGSEMIVYGYIPVMISAQCVIKNCGKCMNKTTRTELTGGQGRKFYAYNHCRYCYNVIYNGEPLSMITQSEEVRSLKPRNIRIVFTSENGDLADEILTEYIKVFYSAERSDYNIKSFTKGHFNRGVE